MKLQDWIIKDNKKFIDVNSRIVIPESTFSYHWSELPTEVIHKNFSHVVDLCREKSMQYKIEGTYQDYRWLLHQNYNVNSDLRNGSRNVFWKQYCIPTEPLNIEYEGLSSILFTEIIDGHISKRRFRLHLDSIVNFVFIRKTTEEHYVKSINVKMVGLTDSFLLLKIPKKELPHFINHNKFRLNLNLREIFSSRRIEKELAEVYTIDLNPVLFEFNDNVLKRLVFGQDKDFSKILRIPFEAFEDGLHAEKCKMILREQFLMLKNDTFDQLAFL